MGPNKVTKQEPKSYIKKTFKVITEKKPKGYYNLIDDSPTPADKKRLDDLAKSLTEAEESRKKESSYKVTPAESRRIRQAVEDLRSEQIVERIKKNMPMMRYKNKK